MIKNLAGLKFGRLTAIKPANNTEQGRAQWLCRCDCGGEKIAQAAYLNRGDTRSCGCLALEQKRNAAQSKCHEMSKRNLRREYSSWQAMNDRCYKPSAIGFENYGGRGICVCDRWRHSFENFVSDMGLRPDEMTLDRIDNDFDYSPANCRWSTRKEQANNRRNNRIITIDGEAMNVQQWAERLGIDCHIIHTRLYLGKDERTAVLQPVRHHHPK